MLFESRRILLGFRIKLNFDAPLKKENSYVFVNLSKTPTIGDLSNAIKERFEISQDIYIALNDCRLLNSEDNSVLIDANEVRIVPCNNGKIIAASKTSQECEIFHLNAQSVPSCISLGDNSNEVSEVKVTLSAPVSKPPRNKELIGKVPSVNESINRKSRRFYSSIAETLKYLNQNPQIESENASDFSNNVITFGEDHKGKQRNVVEELETAQRRKESCDRNDTSFEKIGDDFVEKRKRKRKRKHSKKVERESEFGNVIHDSQYVGSSKETCTDSLPSKSTRQHIFFEGDHDDGTKAEEHSMECDFSNDASTQIPSSNKKVRKIENNIATVGTDVVDMSVCVITDVTHNDDNMEEKQVLVDSTNESDAIPLTVPSESQTTLACARKQSDVKFPESEDVDSPSIISIKPRTTSEKPNESESKSPSSNGFFSTLNAKTNDQNNFQTKDIPRESSDPFATLLLCKQLQSPVEYHVQYTHPNGISRRRSNSCISVGSNKSANSTRSPVIDLISAVSVSDVDESTPVCNDDNECEILCQYKIVGGKILLRDSCGSWNILTEKEASLKLHPVDEPVENQSITFQMLYLGPDMCPNMSDLICGRVLSFRKGIGRLTLNILPAFVENLQRSCEDAGLPDELVHITENVYQISWTAVKNPRLLM